jgi:hypothetical protein
MTIIRGPLPTQAYLIIHTATSVDFVHFFVDRAVPIFKSDSTSISFNCSPLRATNGALEFTHSCWRLQYSFLCLSFQLIDIPFTCEFSGSHDSEYDDDDDSFLGYSTM